MIHQLFTQGENFKKSKKAWDYINKKYNKESLKTRIHIPVHAIHTHMYLKFFNKKRLERDIKWASSFPDYKKAWEMVEKEGYKNIISNFKTKLL